MSSIQQQSGVIGKMNLANPSFLPSSSSMDEDAVKDLLRPAKKHLKKLKSGTDDLPRDDKIVALKECVWGIGERVDQIVAEKKAAGVDAEKWRKHCWVFASYFWPRRGVNYTKVMDIYQKLVSVMWRGLPQFPRRWRIQELMMGRLGRRM